ncbi:MAG: aldehyde dehydrogenase [Spirochaetae bacterium HGW-Spirochaetae-4]|nr:MAG: aldehyde dehydrogenase [Spirochaetae bacterium HGW-Spirochaetae-8]PKL19950.1 MAG: aldehyde dehydrogenase [Spirochaetae bacterium HGW-Spirochaetae-4]
MSGMNEKVLGSYIDGEWLYGEADIEIRDPGDLSKVSSRYHFATAEQVGFAIKVAKDTFESWAEIPAPKRAAYIWKVLELWQNRVEDVARITTKEMGKPLCESRSEATRAMEEMRYWTAEALHLGDRTFESNRPNVEAYSIRQPIGPVAAITPWNFPILSPLRKVIPALICGCTVVLKPAIQAPGPSVLLAQMFEEAGLPKGVFSLIISPGRTVGDLLVNNPAIAGITFTGSTKVGMGIYANAAKRNAKVQLEMGGKNAAVVADYADLSQAAREIVASAFTTCGQRCTSVSRVIVCKNQQKALEQELVNYVKKLKVGYGLDEKTTLGPLSSKEQYKIVKSYLEFAEKEKIGRLLVEGDLPEIDGLYIRPTIITDVKPGSKIAMEEIFGPVLVVIPANDFEDALKIANEVDYGLTSAIFTDNQDYAHRFCIKSQAGMVHMNHGTSSECHVPFGGWKMSGQGAFGISDSSKDFFTVLKSIYRMYK